jgi:hypothetical protein
VPSFPQPFGTAAPRVLQLLQPPSRQPGPRPTYPVTRSSFSRRRCHLSRLPPTSRSTLLPPPMFGQPGGRTSRLVLPRFSQPLLRILQPQSRIKGRKRRIRGRLVRKGCLPRRRHTFLPRFLLFPFWRCGGCFYARSHVAARPCCSAYAYSGGP